MIFTFTEEFTGCSPKLLVLLSDEIEDCEPLMNPLKGITQNLPMDAVSRDEK
jgi:hypothetical protein